VRPAAIATLLAALALAAAAGCGGDIREDELNRSIASIQSSAGDGVLLADGVARDRTKTTFVRAHAREISEDVDHEAEKLNDASAETNLIDEKRRAVELAAEVSDLLGELQTSPEDRGLAATVRHDLRELRDRAQALRDEL
jgi:predicted outer membrane protein